MASSLKLRVSLIQFLADADRTAAMLDRDGDRLAELTGGKVHRGMAEEIRKLVAEVREIEATRDRSRGGSVAPLKREAQRLVSRVVVAAEWAGREDPGLRERLAKVRRECPVRGVSTAALVHALAGWAAFAREHESRLPRAGACALESAARALETHHEGAAQGLAVNRSVLARRDEVLARTGSMLMTARRAARLAVALHMPEGHPARARAVPAAGSSSMPTRSWIG